VLIIVDWVEKHLKLLEELMPESEVLYGSQSKKERQEIREKVINGDVGQLISTVVKEGVDFKPLEITIKASAGKRDINLIQQLGRNMRILEGKRKPVFIDFLHRDSGILQKHSRERIKTFKERGYEVNIMSLDQFMKSNV
jgi:superfamily II DNA or RNA helicase